MAARLADWVVVNINRSRLLVPAIALALTISAIVGVSLIVQRAGSSSGQQVEIKSLALSLGDLQAAPFSADPTDGGSPAESRLRIGADEAAISRGLMTSSQVGVPSALLAVGRSHLGELETLVTRAYRLATAKGGLTAAADAVLAVDGLINRQGDALSTTFASIGRIDATRAGNARTQAQIGAAVAMLLLLAAFAWFYLRSAAARKTVERLARENQDLLAASRVEARTDALTALGNRRALSSKLTSALAASPVPDELLLVMYDLDGFKEFNDTFGHAAGDALLHRLGTRLTTAAAAHHGFAYRMGGDEFCVLARTDPQAAALLLVETGEALTDTGKGWHVGCSLGSVWLPSEAKTESQGLQLADERMYANKTTRSSASRQVTDALLQVVTEQHALRDDHVERVSELSGELAEALGLCASEVSLIRLAGRLHDIGKSAIPAGVLDKRGPLDEAESEFVRRHPGIGERIVLAAPALAGTAAIVRSTHERVDGHGYPDGLSGKTIPLGSRIIAVADAFDAMTSARPYRRARSDEAALKELRRHAGTQFDATIVKVFCTMISTHVVPIGRSAHAA
jgi:diguanylate cyclase (GGDEF)-like protein